MQLRKLYRTIENIASRKFDTAEDLLKRVVEEIVRIEEIKLKGGRVWKFEPKTGCYVLLAQAGDIQTIKPQYRIKVKDYPIFLQLFETRTALATEENLYLREQGIKNYSATGIGDKVKWRDKLVYRYVLAFNADHIDENLTSTLNIISAALSSVLRSKRMEQKVSMLSRDIDKASDIQRSILPQHEMRFNKYELYGISIPDRIVGGDFFDYLQVEGDSERLGFVIGDAASKGFSAAAQALYVSGALRMGFEFQTKINSLLSRVNKLLAKTFSEEHFVSLFYGELTDDKNGLVIYANCGHNNPILFRCKSNSTEFLEATGQMLGPFPEGTFKTESFMMEPDDILLLYTDGITEAQNEDGTYYGEQRLVEHLMNHCHSSSKEITQLILEDVQKFNTLTENSDDKTIVTIKRIN